MKKMKIFFFFSLRYSSFDNAHHFEEKMAVTEEMNFFKVFTFSIPVTFE